jgi:hypothetical protein
MKDWKLPKNASDLYIDKLTIDQLKSLLPSIYESIIKRTII